MTIRLTTIVLALSLAFLGGCESPATGNQQALDDGLATAGGAADTDAQQKEVKVVTATSNEGDAAASSADVRNHETSQATQGGHTQTLGFAGIGGSVGAVIKDDPVLASITTEVDKILAQDAITPEAEARLDKLRGDMVARSDALMKTMSAMAPSFDALKTIVAIFTMETATGHEKTPLTDAAAASKADAFKAALDALKKTVEEGNKGE